MQDKDMVELLLDLKRRLDEVLHDAFARNEAFANGLKDAFEAFINQRQVRTCCLQWMVRPDAHIDGGAFSHGYS